ncbi:nicotinic acid mononucleotide adenylyltransferase [Lysobacteraceae bacterium NML95-0200]|nr:nicotinic acid mononucleotide adenylyltransferase [Xanthomonadaceae bacterium NML95-0200]
MSLRIQYGGSFDPVHLGHLAVARAARDTLRATVHFMPAADPPHKAPTAADASQRLAMLQLAIAAEPGLAIDTRELQREGPSYSIDSVLALRAELGKDRPLALLLGADSFLSLPSWRRWRELLAQVHIVIAERPGSALAADDLPPELAAIAEGRWQNQPQPLQQTAAGYWYRLSLQLRPESSSALRQAIAQGKPHWQAWTTPAVAQYINAHQLYRRR